MDSFLAHNIITLVITMDQGPLTHTNGGYPQGDPILDPLCTGSKMGGPQGGSPQGGFGTPRRALSRAGGPKLSPPGDGGHLTDFVAN